MKRVAIAFLVAGGLIAGLGVAFAPVGAETSGNTGSGPVVAATSNAAGTAGWTVTAGGVVGSTGSAHKYGDLRNFALRAPIVGIAATPSGSGYWLLGSDGGVFTFGGARFYGSTGAMRLNQPIVGIAATPTGHGYWLVARDGGIFAFGDAPFYGSTGAIRLNQPIVGMTTNPGVRGYWLVAADGGVFPFGHAGFEGSTGGIHLVQPVRAIAATHTGHGYWLVASDGGIFAFGDAHFYGSTAGSCVGVVGIIPTTDGYIIAGADGSLRQMNAHTASSQGSSSSCPSSPCPSAYVSAVVAGTNAQRAAHGLRPLQVSGQLQWAAARRSAIQATNNTMSHDGWTTVIQQSGYPAGWWGENVAYGFTTPEGVMTGWMNSEGHRENILSSNYSNIGVGCAYSRTHVAYWTQDFGS